jgi:hypothetical protein
MPVANALAYYDTATITAVKSLIVMASGVNLCKTYCKLGQTEKVMYHFYDIQLFSIALKRVSLAKKRINLMQSLPHKIASRGLSYKTFYGRIFYY